MKPKKLAAVAVLIEFIGLVVLLLGAFWQSRVSGWWDQSLPEWQNYIQEDVNLAVLGAIKDLASMEETTDESVKKRLRDDIETRTWRSMTRAVSEREKRSKAVEGGQASVLWNIRDTLMLSGALILALGKYVAVRAAFADSQ